MRFKLFITRGVNSLINTEVIDNNELLLLLRKFISNDWVILCNKDKIF